jgi:heptosyltransferase III
LDRILVIRGGAIGDFILTLPALKALRDSNPGARIEILGYKHIAVLTENRFYAEAVRSIEYGALSGFFARGAVLPDDLGDYFRSFDLILSYLYDPDRIFEENLGRAGARKILAGPAKIDNHSHAARQLAKPLEELGLEVVDLAAKIFPSSEDRQFAREFLGGRAQRVVALHPGSGSEKKNWPLEQWIQLANRVLGQRASRNGGFPAADLGKRRSGDRRSLMLIAGEADDSQVARLEREWKDRDVRFAKNLPLPHLAAVLEGTVFVGHDSGISHLAAAAGADCVLLFGPTDPAIWAPRNEKVQVIRAPSGRMEDVDLAQVAQALMRIGIKT